ncbi:MAG: hypothetical protein JXA44_08325 [Methanospirillaceae archaeon]|nr:hypothetical protein [Methanospirillaceae archaeon]
MAVNQAQVDSIISSASAEDPEIQLLKLKDEVELLKTSIKRLLIDIRERMNDAENPLVQALKGQPVEMVGGHQAGIPAPMDAYIDDYDEDVEEEEEETEDMNEDEMPVPGEPIKPGSPAPMTAPAGGGYGSDLASSLSSLAAEKDMLESLRNQIFSGPQVRPQEPVKPKKPKEKVKIQKVYSLFEWTMQNVQKYGHDRVDLMLESYKEMGHISEEACKQVKDIARLMSPSIGEVHEIKADDFVLALYELNRILLPQDSTLDRDMIDLLIEKRTESVQKEGDETYNSIIEEDINDFEYIPSDGDE